LPLLSYVVGGWVVNAFQVAVFLLSLKAGAAGLTLTAASRVFLLEPGLDPAIEQQAVARVHRIGQEREVLITRLLLMSGG
jgi:SNF2 family DNA or RNA helicase